MKKLTVSTLALSGIRSNPKKYRLLLFQVFLSVFLCVATLLALDGMILQYTADINAAHGSQDAFLFNVDSLSPEDPVQRGLARKAGCITVVGSSGGFPVGYYDDTARELLCRNCISGRLPLSKGEIALDAQVAKRLFPNARIGDTLILALSVSDGSIVKSDYRLVGILQPQNVDDSRSMLLEAYPQANMALPSILLSGEEELPPVARHLAIRFSFFGNLQRIKDAYPQYPALGLDSAGAYYTDKPLYSPLQTVLEQINMGSSILLAGFSLLLCTLVGIFSVVSGQSQQREQQYRTLRTIGATKRQLRVISSREAVLLTLFAAIPAGLCAALFVWGVGKVFPASFSPSNRPSVIFIGILATTALVWIAASLPAFFASYHFSSPSLSKGTRHRRIASKQNYSLPSLLARRDIRFHPFRQITAIILIFCLNVAVIITIVFAGETVKLNQTDQELDSVPAYMELASTFWSNSIFCYENRYSISPDALEEISALPGVAEIKGYWHASTTVLTDHIGTYFPKTMDSNLQLAAYRPELYDSETLEWLRDRKSYQSSVEECKKIQELLNTEDIPLYLDLIVVSDLSELEPSLTQGSIDPDAIQAGTAVLLNVPQRQVRSSRSFSETQSPSDVETVQNDQFSLGETLNVVELCLITQEDCTPNSPKNWEQVQFRQAHPIVCGILNKGDLSFMKPCIVTSIQGAKNLGFLCNALKTIKITLDDTITQEEKDQLRSKLDQISLREDDVEVIDFSPITMESFNASRLRHSLFQCGVVLILLMLTLLLMQEIIRSQIRARARSIGVLRAVGCDRKALHQQLRKEIGFTIVTAGILAWLFYSWRLVSNIWDRLQEILYGGSHITGFLCCLACSAALLLIGDRIIAGEVGKITSQYVMENLRQE